MDNLPSVILTFVWNSVSQIIPEGTLLGATSDSSAYPVMIQKLVCGNIPASCTLDKAAIPTAESVRMARTIAWGRSERSMKASLTRTRARFHCHAFDKVLVRLSCATDAYPLLSVFRYCFLPLTAVVAQVRNQNLLRLVKLLIFLVIIVRQARWRRFSRVRGLTLSKFADSRAKACTLMKFGSVTLRRLSHFYLN